MLIGLGIGYALVLIGTGCLAYAWGDYLGDCDARAAHARERLHDRFRDVCD